MDNFVTPIQDGLASLSRSFQNFGVESILQTFTAGEERVDAAEGAGEKLKAQAQADSADILAVTGGALAAITSLTDKEGRKQFRINQARAIASAIVNTAEGITKALAKEGPLGIGLAVAIAAIGAAQIAVIASASPGGGGAPTVGGGGTPATEGPGAPVQEEAAGGPQGNIINITVTGVIGDEAEAGARILELIREQLGDGVQLSPSP